MRVSALKKIFINRNHIFYFALLILAAIWLSVLHWIVNPYKLAIWINASDTGYISVESRCGNQDGIAQKNSLSVVGGYIQYEFSLPKCDVSTIEITNASKHGQHYEISSAAVTYYGKEIRRLLGRKLTLEGEGIYDNDSRPNLVGAAVLAIPLVLNVTGTKTTETRIEWPRYLPVILLPFIWWFSKKLANGQSSDLKRNGFGGAIAFPAVAAFSLIAVMAVVARTDVSVHPDELTHVASARYYYDHWLKPKIGAPETLDAHKTNAYGVAYLTGTDPVYQLASKFAVATWPIFENDVVALRMFNVVLFGLLVLMALRVNDARLALIPLLVTPQAWYIFSYFNGEGLPLFLSMLVMMFFFSFTKFDKPFESRISLQRIFLIGCLIGGILLSKPNYWTVLGAVALLIIAHGEYLTKENFLLMALGWLFALFGLLLFLDNHIALPVLIRLLPICVGIGLLFFTGVKLTKSVIKRYKLKLIRIKPMTVMLVGLIMVLGLKMADEAWQNPLPFSAERTKVLSEIREITADSKFKPSALDKNVVGKTHQMRAQGVGLNEILLEKTWFKTSVTSFFGVYGYLNIWSSKYLSYIQLLLFIAITVSVFRSVVQRNVNGAVYSVPISLLVGGITVVAASVGFSWIYDYQPQGKYLLPILPILAGGMLIANQRVKNNTFRWFIIGAFLLSAYSFLMVGIRWIPKQPGIY